MISRLTAFRAAFQIDPFTIAPLIDIEFAGRTCGDATRALWDVELESHGYGDAPFSVARLLEIMQDGDFGRRIRAVNDHEVALLHDHIDQLRSGHRRITLCDTGVYGSILRYLQVGVPAIDWQLVVLFRANYKRIAASHFDRTIGAVSESNIYLPWHPRTAALLHWPFLEALFEPSLSTVRCYHREPSGKIVSNLELPRWEQALEQPTNPILAEAFRYLRQLTPASLPTLESRAKASWRRLRRMIVFPSKEDVERLQVGARCLDFGSSELVHFSSIRNKLGGSFREKRSIASASIWPEGELRKQMPRMAAPLLLASELSRWIRALKHSQT